MLLLGDTLFEVRGDAVRALGAAALPLGFALVGDAVELIARQGPTGLEVQRFEGVARVVRRAVTSAHRSEGGRTVRPEYAWHDGAGWRVIFSEHPSTAVALPVPITLHEETESGGARVLGTVQGDEALVHHADGTGQVYLRGESLQGGAVLGVSLGVRRVFVRRGESFEPVEFGTQRSVEAIGAMLVEGGPAKLFFAEAIYERAFWLDGEALELVPVGSRLVALRARGRTGPPVVPSFWLGGGVRPAPDGHGGYVITGALGRSIVRVGPDLARSDPLSFGERFVRLFVEDRAKRNADYFHGLGILRSVTVPWLLAGPLLGLAGLGLAHRRPRAVIALGATWLAFALAGLWHFTYVLRFYW